MSSQTIDGLFERYGPTYKWLATATVVMGTLATALSTTIINVAIPDIMGAFGIGQDKAQWLATGFLAANTAAMLANAWFVQSFGQRNTFVGALSIFIVASLLGAVANHENLVILSRVMQGACAGLLQPLAMLVMFRVFPDDERGKAMGYYGIGIILAPAFGPTFGGIMVDTFSWRTVFLVAPVFSVIGIVMAGFFLPDREGEGPRAEFDWLGFALLSLFLTSLLMGLSNGPREGWQSDYILMLFAIAACAGVGFVLWELHTEKPLLELHVFTHMGFATASAVGIIFGMGMFGSIYLVPLFSQLIMGLTPTMAGMLLMPGGLAMGLMMPVGGRLADKYPPHYLVFFGFSLFAISSFLMVGVGPNSAFWTIAFLLLIGRVGLAVLMPAINITAMGALPMNLLSQGSGAINFIRQLGGAFGVNALSLVLTQRTGFHSAQLATTQLPSNTSTTVFVDSIAAFYAQAGLPVQTQIAAAYGHLSQAIYGKAFLFAFRDGFFISGLIFLVGFIPALMMRRVWKQAQTAG